MRIKNNDKTYFRAVCIVLFSLAFTGCTKDGLNEFGPGNATGKVVMVSLNVSLPPIEEPTSTSEYTTVKPFLRNENSSDSYLLNSLLHIRTNNNPSLIGITVYIVLEREAGVGIAISSLSIDQKGTK